MRGFLFEEGRWRGGILQFEKGRGIFLFEVGRGYEGFSNLRREEG